MKQRRLSLILGILFGICLFPIAYICLALGIALAFAGNKWFGNFVYVFAVLGLVVIVCSCFAKKKPLVTLISNATASIALLGAMIYLIGQGLMFANIGLFLLFAFAELLGLLSTLFAGRAYHKQWFKGEDAA